MGITVLQKYSDFCYVIGGAEGVLRLINFKAERGAKSVAELFTTKSAISCMCLINN